MIAGRELGDSAIHRLRHGSGGAISGLGPLLLQAGLEPGGAESCAGAFKPWRALARFAAPPAAFFVRRWCEPLISGERPRWRWPAAASCGEGSPTQSSDSPTADSLPRSGAVLVSGLSWDTTHSVPGAPPSSGESSKSWWQRPLRSWQIGVTIAETRRGTVVLGVTAPPELIGRARRTLQSRTSRPIPGQPPSWQHDGRYSSGGF